MFIFNSKATSSIITYKEILDDPTDLELNLNYAKQQENAGNVKSTIATLERLSMLYPKNTDIKLYLLSILLKMDSKVKVDFMVKTMLDDPNTTDETKKDVELKTEDKTQEDGSTGEQTKSSDPETEAEAKKVAEALKEEIAQKLLRSWSPLLGPLGSQQGALHNALIVTTKKRKRANSPASGAMRANLPASPPSARRCGRVRRASGGDAVGFACRLY